MLWLLEIDLLYGTKYQCFFSTIEEAFIEHQYLESEGLDVNQWSLVQTIKF